MRVRYVDHLGPNDIGQRVVVRWREPAGGTDGQLTDVLGILEEASDEGYTVRRATGDAVVIAKARVLAAKVVPPPPARSPRPDATPLTGKELASESASDGRTRASPLEAPALRETPAP